MEENEDSDVMLYRASATAIVDITQHIQSMTSEGWNCPASIRTKTVLSIVTKV